MKTNPLMNDQLIEEDEIDLVKLVSSSADVANQYVIFEGSDNKFYALNVAKVEELFTFDTRDVMRNNNDENLIFGTSNIRSRMIPLVYFDQWYGNELLSENSYDLMILCYFSEKYLGIVVKQVIDIISIEPSQMYPNAENNDMTTFIAKISIGQNEIFCTIFDTDKLLMDLFKMEQKSDKGLKKIDSNKLVLFADDSKLLLKLAKRTFEDLGVSFKLYPNGEELIEDLQNLKAEEIGLFLLDIEMPKKTGIDVINYLKSKNEFKDLPIIVHTNMANSSITTRLEALNVDKIVTKIDFETIKNMMRDYL